jgi:glycosyltransferase involved in cell wall biosynthesis
VATTMTRVGSSRTRTPKFSVLMSNYNYGRYLMAAVDSVLDQTVSDFEIIIVDDGSTDDSPQIIEDLCKKDDRIRGVMQRNLGQAIGLNRAFAESRGRIICLLDSDDLWKPTKLERVGRAIADSPDAAVVQHQLYVIRHDSKRVKRFCPRLSSGKVVNDIATMKQIAWFVPTSGLAFPRAIYTKISPIPEHLTLCADAYVARAAVAHGRLFSIDTPLGYYRIHGANGWTGNPNRKNPDRMMLEEVMPAVLDHYRQNGIRNVSRKWMQATLRKDAVMDAHLLIHRIRQLKESYKRIAIYGAGSHTSWLLELLAATDIYPDRMPEVVAVIDHMAEKRPRVGGFAVQTPKDVPSSAFDAILLSTDSFQEPMRKRLRRAYRNPITIDLYEGVPNPSLQKVSIPDFVRFAGDQYRTGNKNAYPRAKDKRRAA